MTVASYLIICFLAPTIVLLNFRLLATSDNFYQKEFAQLGVYNVLEKNTARVQSKNLIDYLCCSGKLDTEFFTERERLHLTDVKALIKQAQLLLLINLVLVITISLALLLKKKQEALFSAIKTGAIVGIGAIFILAVSSLINFDFLFVKFHLISFSNDLWLLPPESNLIKLFPQRFFQDLANRVAAQSIMMLILVFVVANWLSRKLK